jgi:hypothetical protein
MRQDATAVARRDGALLLGPCLLPDTLDPTDLRGSGLSEHSRDIRSDQLIWCTRCALRMFPHMPRSANRGTCHPHRLAAAT